MSPSNCRTHCGAKILIPTGARTISLAFGRTAFSKVPLWIGTETFWVVNVPFGQILRTSHQGDWTVAAKYEGNPNDLKIRNDGLSISPTTRTVS